MSKGIVECIHWDPEVDPGLEETRRKNKKYAVIAAVVIAVVAIAACLVFFGPLGELLDVPEPAVDDPGPPTGVEINTQPVTAGSNLAQAIEYYKTGQYSAAMTILDLEIVKSGNAATAYTYRGLCKFNLSQYQEAVSDFTMALRCTPGDAELVTIYTFRGGSWFFLEYYYEAIGDLSRAIELDPNSASAYTYRARAYENTNQFPLAQADYVAAEALQQQQQQQP